MSILCIKFSLALYIENVDDITDSVCSINPLVNFFVRVMYTKNSTLWTADSLKLQPLALINNNQAEEVALLHCGNAASLISKSQGQSYRVKDVTSGEKRRWDSNIKLNDKSIGYEY